MSACPLNTIQASFSAAARSIAAVSSAVNTVPTGMHGEAKKMHPAAARGALQRSRSRLQRPPETTSGAKTWTPPASRTRCAIPQ